MQEDGLPETYPGQVDRREKREKIRQHHLPRELMISDDFLMIFVGNTNKKINYFYSITGDAINSTDKKTHLKLTSLTEVKAWFGILYLRGALQINETDTDTVWYHESSHDIFATTMQRKRFTFLTHIIQFDDLDTRRGRDERTISLRAIGSFSKM